MSKDYHSGTHAGTGSVSSSSATDKPTITSRFKKAISFTRKRGGTGSISASSSSSGAGRMDEDMTDDSIRRYGGSSGGSTSGSRRMIDSATGTRGHHSHSMSDHRRMVSGSSSDVGRGMDSTSTAVGASLSTVTGVTGHHHSSSRRSLASISSSGTSRYSTAVDSVSDRKSSRHSGVTSAAAAAESAADASTEIVWTQELIAEKLGLDTMPAYRADEKGYIHFEKGLLVNDQYVLMETLGRGTFSKVFESINLVDGRKYALKIIRNSHRYIEAAKTELRVLEHITATDTGRSCCVHLKDSFSWNRHPCFLFKLYGPSIYAIMSKNHYRPFPPTIVRNLSVQICSAIQFMHRLGIIFTDLKPENIVFVDGRTQAVMIDGKQNFLPVDTRVKVVDFGSAVYEPVFDPANKATHRFRYGYNYLIQTRHYRAPEVVLEMCWKRPVDIWSIGCVILEFIYGSMVFNTHCPIDHLNQMKSMIGAIPDDLIEQASERKLNELFHSGTFLLRMDSAKKSRAQAKKLSSYFNFRIEEYKDLYHLVKSMLQWHASKRIDADTMMRHRYWASSDPRKRTPAAADPYASSTAAGASAMATSASSSSAVSTGAAKSSGYRR